MRLFACPFCQRLRQYRTEENRPTCDAFPTGIPDEIRFGRNFHTSPFPGDHGLQFLPEEGEEWIETLTPAPESTLAW